jgi:hypothetical protein
MAITERLSSFLMSSAFSAGLRPDIATPLAVSACAMAERHSVSQEALAARIEL